MAGDRLRLFVALDLPAGARDGLERWRDEALGTNEALRPVPAQALHVTLAFLGWRSEGDAPAIAGAVGDAVAGLAAPELAAGNTRAVPPRRPRLLALDLADTDGRCAAVQAAVAAALERGSFYEPEKRPFWAHVTLARVRRGHRAPREAPAGPALPPFTADTVTLYRSHLGRDGAVYEPLERWSLERSPKP